MVVYLLNTHEGGTMARKRKFIPNPTIEKAQLAIGQVVRFWHKRFDGWYVGRIKVIGHKWLTLDYRGKPHKLSVNDWIVVYIDGRPHDYSKGVANAI
jgi:hypothetical protein